MPKYLGSPKESLCAWFPKVYQLSPSLFHLWTINQIKNNWSAASMSATYWSSHWALLKYSEGDENHQCIEKWANEGPSTDLFPLSFLIRAIIFKIDFKAVNTWICMHHGIMERTGSKFPFGHLLSVWAYTCLFISSDFIHKTNHIEPLHGDVIMWEPMWGTS